MNRPVLQSDSDSDSRSGSSPPTGLAAVLGASLTVLLVLAVLSALTALAGFGFAGLAAGALDGVATEPTAELTTDPPAEVTILNNDSEDGQTLSGSPELTVEAPNNTVLRGEEATLELLVSNEAFPAGDGDDPTDLRLLVSAAAEAQFDIEAHEGQLFEVAVDAPSPGNLEPRDQHVPVSFVLAIDEDADSGEHEVEVTVTYTDVTEIRYVHDDEADDGYRILSEETDEVTETFSITIVVEREPSLLAQLIWLLPPIIPAVIFALWALGRQPGRTRLTLNRLSRVLFGRFVSPSSERKRRIEAAYIGTTYRTYAAKTLLYTVLACLAGAIVGGYLVAGLLLVLEPLVRALAGLPETITRPVGIHPEFTFDVSRRTRWVIVLAGGVVSGLLTASLAYSFRWRLPASRATVRKRGINEGLPRTTAFMYALSRGGMEFPPIIRTVTDYREVYGETANELSIAVREMDLFGRDMITALRRMSSRTPSEQFKTFSENLTSVLQSGADLPDFFSEQYDRFREEAEERQNELLEFLATIAEAYVTVLVAGMLFFITILLVFGLTVADTLWLLQAIIYGIIPLANIGFAVFLQQQLSSLGIGGEGKSDVLERMSAPTPIQVIPSGRGAQAGQGTNADLAGQETRAGQVEGRPDGGTIARHDEGRRMLGLHDRINRVNRVFKSPHEVILWNPETILWLVVPLAILIFAIRVPSAFAAEGVTVRVLDDLIIQSVFIVLAGYAMARYAHKRHILAIERATPELLERLASLNEAGMSVVQSLSRVRGSDLGVLTPEVDRIWRDIEYGANVDDALIRFGRRVRTIAITRVVVLVTNAMRASGNMGPVLRVASEQARSELKLRQQRRQQMFTYLVVIYISFFVFLVIILAVNEVLVPSLPDTLPEPGGEDAERLGASPDALARFGAVDQASYTLIFFHAALIQAVCAGFIGGQLGEGSLRDGAKHAAIMLGIAYLAFVLLASPIASLTVESEQVEREDGTFVYEVTSDGVSLSGIDELTLSDGGFVAVYDDDGINGTMYGHTGYLPPGSHSTVEIPLFESIEGETVLRLVVHRDTTGTQEFEFEAPYDPETAVDRPYPTPSEDDEPGIEVRVLHR